MVAIWWWGHQNWNIFLHYWPFVREIHWSPLKSPHKGQWCGALMLSLICAWINGWINNHDAGDLICHHSHFYATVVLSQLPCVNVKEALFQPDQSSDPLPDKGVRRCPCNRPESSAYCISCMWKVGNGILTDWTLRCISIGLCNKDVTPLLMHWSYVFLALTHWYQSHDMPYEPHTDCAITIIHWQEMTYIQVG